MVTLTRFTSPAPFKRLNINGDHITVNVSDKNIVIPSGDPDLLIDNEYVLDPKRLTASESPFGGKKGFLDYCPGTVFVNQGDGVYLTDINGQNPTKTLTAGKLVELGNLTINTNVHTITEEFILKNTSQDNNSFSICNCDSITDWSGTLTTPALDTTNKQEGTGCISGTCTTAGDMSLVYDPTGVWNLSNYDFLTISVKGTSGKTIRFLIQTNSSNYFYWGITATGLWQNVILPLRKPSGSTGSPSLSNAGYLAINLLSAAVNDTLLVDNIKVDVGKPAYIELQTPDYLADTSAQIYTHNGTAYQLANTCKLNSGYINITTTDANFTFADGTKVSNVYGTGLGRSIYSKGVSTEVVSGSLSGSQITYSNNHGAKNRIGLMVMLPPSDDGRTCINQVRLKLVTYYDDRFGNKVLDLSRNGNNGTLVGGVTKLNTGGLKFDGTTGYVSCPWSDVPNSNYEIILTFSGAQVSTLNQTIFCFGNLAAWIFIRIISNSKKITFMQQDDNGSMYTFASNAVVTDGNIHTVRWTRVGNVLSIYIDGVFDNSITVPISTTTTVSCSFGAYSNGSVTFSYFNGNIYSVEVLANGVKKYEYAPTVKNMGSTTYEFDNSTNASYGLQNMVYPWLAVHDPGNKWQNFFMFSYKPKNLAFRRDESGKTYELDLYPGNGSIKYGQIYHTSPSLDSNSDYVPDCLSIDKEGSIAKLLKPYRFINK